MFTSRPQRHPRHQRRQLGMNLVEMSIALVVLGIVIGGALVPLQVQFEREQIRNAEQYLRDAKQAVMSYAVQNKTAAKQVNYFNGLEYDIPAGRPYLPCPDIDNDGLEDRQAFPSSDAVIDAADLKTVGGCTEQKGLLPWKTLGLKGADTWGNRLVYAVDESYSNQVLGLDETFHADIFDRRITLVDVSASEKRLSKRSSKDKTGLIICDNFQDNATGGCPNADMNNVLAGVVVDANITLGARLVPAFTGNTSSVVDGVVDGAAFVLLSHGKNGRGAVSSAGVCQKFPGGNTQKNLIEEANAYYRSGHTLRSICPDDSVSPSSVAFYENLFVSAPISKVQDDNVNAPDDLLLWTSSNELMGFLLKSGALPIDKLEFLPE